MISTDEKELIISINKTNLDSAVKVEIHIDRQEDHLGTPHEESQESALLPREEVTVVEGEDYCCEPLHRQGHQTHCVTLTGSGQLFHDDILI